MMEQLGTTLRMTNLDQGHIVGAKMALAESRMINNILCFALALWNGKDPNTKGKDIWLN